MDSQETVLCSAGASSSSQGLGAISVHDFQTGTLLASFKQTCADVHSTAVIPTRNGEGGFVLAAQPDKSILNAYYFQKDQVALKMVLPERLSCIDIDCSGNFCAAGTSQGRIYLWEIASGILFNVWNAHYRRVSVIRFTQDGAAILSGSDDSGVSVWLVSSLLDNDTQQDIPVPHFSLSDHTLPITDIICGVGNFPFCRVLTSSVDHSVKLWDIASQSLLTTFMFPGPIHALSFDKAERFFFAATSDDSKKSSSIFEKKLYRSREDHDGQSIAEAIGGAGLGEAIHASPVGSDVIQIDQRISCLALSMTQSTLLVGTNIGEVHLYDVASHQFLRTFTPVKDKTQGLGITHIECLLKPPDLIGNISLGFNVSSLTSAKDVIATIPIQPFQRVRDVKARALHEVSMLLHSSEETMSNPTSYPMSELLKDQAQFISPQTLGNGAAAQINSHAQQAKVEELEVEVERLRLQLSKAKGVNDAMWEAVVHRVVGSKGESIPINGTDMNGLA